MMRLLWPKALIWGLLMVSLSGCVRQEKQFTAEAQVAFAVIAMLERHDHENPGARVTNMLQLVSALNGDYPHKWDKEFRRYGKYAGFTNSFYEKHIFLPANTNQSLGGEMVLINAEPYPAPYGEMQRTLIVKTPQGYYRKPLREDRVQELLNQARIEMTRPIAMPAPPVPPPTIPPESFLAKLSSAFFGFTYANGINHGIAVALWYFLLSLPAILVVGFGFWLWRRTLK